MDMYCSLYSAQCCSETENVVLFTELAFNVFFPKVIMLLYMTNSKLNSNNYCSCLIPCI